MCLVGPLAILARMNHSAVTLLAGSMLAGMAPLAAQQKGAEAPEIEFVKVWNDGPKSFDELAGKVVILDFGATW